MKSSRWGAAIAAALALLAAGAPKVGAAPLPGGSQDPLAVPKFVQPLLIPPVMPQTAKPASLAARAIDYYEIAVRQFRQQILPPGLPATTVWSYGSANNPASFSYPAFTVEAKQGRPVRVKWINDLKDPVTGNYLPHLLPIDQTLHWANPPGGPAGRDARTTNPRRYTGPVPVVVHLHGGHTADHSDGYPEAWFLPAASDIPAGFAREGTFYARYRAKAQSALGQAWTPGTAVFEYGNQQAATTLWYHDHSIGMTRANVYAGPAGFYLIRGGVLDTAIGALLPGPAPAAADPPGLKYYEIPIVIQDRAFNADGSLFYPESRLFFDGFPGPYIGDSGGRPSDISPIWNPEVFTNTMVVNGRAWPYLEVEARRYRFRFLNGSDARFLILENYVNRTGTRLPFWQIGADGGFLPRPEQRTDLLLGPAERADVIVDFTNVPSGTNVTLLNLGPDEPFGGGLPGVDFVPSDPATTGRVMQFRVVSPTSADLSTPPALLPLPPRVPLPAATSVRRISLNELESGIVCVDAGNQPVPCESPAAVGFAAPREAMLGTVATDPVTGLPTGVPRPWMDPVTERPVVGATETWEIHNFTEDAHPIHIHEVQFEIVNRQVMNLASPNFLQVRGPDPGESGRKDTVVAYPGEITRVKATYDQAGLYVWHCHILEHEDNEMMRPYRIGGDD